MESVVLNKYPIQSYDVKELCMGIEDIKGAPEHVYYRGDISLLRGNVVAVIGSREISEWGKAITKNISRALCGRGKTVLNGLALGCDALALQETIDCGGKGIAVMPCGLDEIYPKTNRELAENLLENGGCLVSEYPERTKPRKERFIERDRLQALFSELVIVVESRQGSGTWHTVEYARRYQKVVACYLGKGTREDDGNEILVRENKAYALRDNAGMDYIIEMSHNRYEQLSLPM